MEEEKLQKTIELKTLFEQKEELLKRWKIDFEGLAISFESWLHEVEERGWKKEILSFLGVREKEIRKTVSLLRELVKGI